MELIKVIENLEIKSDLSNLSTQELIEKYSLEASMVPYNLYLLTERVQVIADELFIIGNKNVVSDAKIASDLCYSIYPGCVLNIKANINNVKDLNALNLLKTIKLCLP